MKPHKVWGETFGDVLQAGVLRLHEEVHVLVFYGHMIKSRS